MTVTPIAKAPIARAKERTAQTSDASALEPGQSQAIRQLANDLHRLNHAVMAAVEAGVSVELVRSARHHGEDGCWGDMMVPVIVKR